MFRIKICGITNVADAVAAVDAGADAIGLNFYEHSPRFIDAELARQIASAVAREIDVGGVFVNASSKRIVGLMTTERVELSAVQIHGDETPQQFAGLVRALDSMQADMILAQVLEKAEGGNRTIKAIFARRLNTSGARMVAVDVKECIRVMARPTAVLVDASAQDAYGGTGITCDWDELAMYESWLGDTPLILAGGLTPDNVAEAIRIVRPAAVDVASGVESAPGKKDPIKVRDFVAAASAAFNSIQGERGA